MTHINNNKKREILTNKEKNLFFFKKNVIDNHLLYERKVNKKRIFNS
jgi:hypothetical protein